MHLKWTGILIAYQLPEMWGLGVKIRRSIKTC